MDKLSNLILQHTSSTSASRAEQVDLNVDNLNVALDVGAPAEVASAVQKVTDQVYVAVRLNLDLRGLSDAELQQLCPLFELQGPRDVEFFLQRAGFLVYDCASRALSFSHSPCGPLQPGRALSVVAFQREFDAAVLGGCAVTRLRVCAQRIANLAALDSQAVEQLFIQGTANHKLEAPGDLGAFANARYIGLQNVRGLRCEQLARLRRLRQLNLQDVDGAGQPLRYVAGLPELYSVTVFACEFGEALAATEGLARLGYLCVEGDVAIAPEGALENVRQIDVRGCLAVRGRLALRRLEKLLLRGGKAQQDIDLDVDGCPRLRLVEVQKDGPFQPRLPGWQVEEVEGHPDRRCFKRSEK